MSTPDAEDARLDTRVVRRRVERVLWIVAISVSVLAVLLVAAAWRNDRTITSNEGFATAEVLSAGRLRSAVSYVTPDGLTHNPQLGVLYPTNLIAGQRIDVEYAEDDPELVRVAGRDASVAIVPAGSVIVVTWMVALPLIWYVRRRPRDVAPA